MRCACALPREAEKENAFRCDWFLILHMLVHLPGLHGYSLRVTARLQHLLLLVPIPDPCPVALLPPPVTSAVDRRHFLATRKSIGMLVMMSMKAARTRATPGRRQYRFDALRNVSGVAHRSKHATHDGKRRSPELSIILLLLDESSSILYPAQMSSSVPHSSGPRG